jgi:hypothetical protein
MYLRRHRVELRRRPAGEEDPGPLAGEGAARASYGPSAPIDHGVFAFKQHLYPP